MEGDPEIERRQKEVNEKKEFRCAMYTCQIPTAM